VPLDDTRVDLREGHACRGVDDVAVARHRHCRVHIVACASLNEPYVYILCCAFYGRIEEYR
jgi:hypothetical protein